MLSKGVVLKIDGEYATVGVKRQSACDTCRANCGGHCDKASTVETVVKNTLNAKAGDTVRLYSSTANVLFYATVVFIAPLISATLGFSIPYAFGGTTIVNSVSAAVCFLLSYVAIWKLFGNKKSYDTIEMYDIVS